MSHLKEREEKVCLNCGSELTGRYCHNCGQENVEPKESAWHLIMHFFSDLFHFDGKFFSTMKLLATKPGFLTEEYVKGRRVSYLNPIRMYLFVSAAFFLIFMSFFLSAEDTPAKTKTPQQDSVATARKKQAYKDINKSIQGIAEAIEEEPGASNIKIDTNYQKGNLKITVGDETIWVDTTTKVKKRTTFMDLTLHEYDSTQKHLPKEKRDGAFSHHYKRKILTARAAWRENPKEMQHRFVADFFHSLPYTLFLSLPLIALLLKLLYIRRKQFYYVSHAIFTVNFYIFVFITLLLVFTLERCGTPGEFVAFALYCGLYVYLFLAMKRFYKQGGFKTFIKFILLGFFGSMTVGMLALIAAFNAAINVAATH